jgi:hypothetical protein
MASQTSTKYVGHQPFSQFAHMAWLGCHKHRHMNQEVNWLDFGAKVTLPANSIATFLIKRLGATKT